MLEDFPATSDVAWNHGIDSKLARHSHLEHRNCGLSVLFSQGLTTAHCCKLFLYFIVRKKSELDAEQLHPRIPRFG